MVSVRASRLLHLASPKAAPCRAVPPRRTSLGAARGAPPTERCGAGAQRRRGSSWKLIFYRTPRKKIREANYGDNHRGLRAFPWKSGVARDYLTPCSNLCGRRARAVVAWHLGSPPGPKTLGFWLWFGVAATAGASRELELRVLWLGAHPNTSCATERSQSSSAGGCGAGRAALPRGAERDHCTHTRFGSRGASSHPASPLNARQPNSWHRLSCPQPRNGLGRAVHNPHDA